MKFLALVVLISFAAVFFQAARASEDDSGPISPSALSDMLEAAGKGDAEAQFELGDLYAEGAAVPEDDVEAVKWFSKSASQGNVRAESNLGLMYEEGKAVPRDQNMAVSWFRKAAEQGDGTAQGFLEAAVANACHSEDQCRLVYSCGDAAINEGHLTNFEAFPACQQSRPHDPNASAHCISGECRAVVTSCHADAECSVAWSECGEIPVKKDNIGTMQPAVRSCLTGILHRPHAVGICVDNKCALSE